MIDMIEGNNRYTKYLSLFGSGDLEHLRIIVWLTIPAKAYSNWSRSDGVQIRFSNSGYGL